MVNLKKYYSTKTTGDYHTENYYHFMTEVMNLVSRVKSTRKFFSKYVKNGAKVLDLGRGYVVAARLK